MRVIVDFDTCESHGLCVEQAPEVFELRDAALFLLQDSPDESLRPMVEQAAAMCPTEAIFIVD
jgi:ferredoxin